MPIPEVALREVLFWLVALFFGGFFGGAAAKAGGLAVSELIYRHGGDRRRGDIEPFREILVVHKETLAASGQVFSELKSMNSAVLDFSAAVNRSIDQSLREHAEIRKDIWELEIPRRAVPR